MKKNKTNEQENTKAREDFARWCLENGAARLYQTKPKEIKEKGE